MSVINAAVSFMPMARKEQPATRTEQVNFRLKSATVERMEAYKERHPLHPTLTQIVEAAVALWLNENEPSLPKKLPREKRE
jgi:hypothetical protein